MTRRVVFTGDIFRLQPRGGITRYVIETASRLRRPVEVVAGWHVSAELAALGPRARAARRRPEFPGATRLAAPVNAAIDRACLPRRGAILHPTYYRDPRTLPRHVPVVVTVHDMIHEQAPASFRRPWWSRRDPARHKLALCARADRIVCYSEHTRATLAARAPVLCGRTRVIPLASRDWSGVTPQPLSGVDGPFLLWVGERWGYKNFERTTAALANCPAAAGTSIVCVGGPPLGATERAVLDQLGLGGRVRRIVCDDGGLRWAYEHALGLLYTSIAEGFGLPVVEAMALGCPVLCGDRSSLPEVGGDVAIYADPESPVAIRDGLERLLASGRSAGLTAALRAQAARFSWEATAAGHDALYAELD